MIRIPDVAARLSISKRTVESLIQAGVFPAYKLGRLVFLDFDEVVRAIKKHGYRQDAETTVPEETEGHN